MPMRGAWDALHDVDNRLKTIFDALRMAKGPNELGGGTTQRNATAHIRRRPIFCRYERRGKRKNAERFQSVRGFRISRGTDGARAPRNFRILQRSLRPLDNSPRPG